MADTPKMPASEVMARARAGAHADVLLLAPSQKSWEEPTMPAWEYFLGDALKEIAALEDAGYEIVLRGEPITTPFADATVVTSTGDVRVGAATRQQLIEALENLYRQLGKHMTREASRASALGRIEMLKRGEA